VADDVAHLFLDFPTLPKNRIGSYLGGP